MDKIFNQKEYQKKWQKENKSQFKVDLNKDEKKELDKLLEQENFTKAQFLRKAIANFKEELKMKNYIVFSRTQIFEKRGENNSWISCGDATFGHDIQEIFSNYEEALKRYNSIELKDDLAGSCRYSDYKEMYEFDLRDFSKEDIENGDYDLDKMKLLKDDYSFLA